VTRPILPFDMARSTLSGFRTCLERGRGSGTGEARVSVSVPVAVPSALRWELRPPPLTKYCQFESKRREDFTLCVACREMARSAARSPRNDVTRREPVSCLHKSFYLQELCDSTTHLSQRIPPPSLTILITSDLLYQVGTNCTTCATIIPIQRPPTAGASRVALRGLHKSPRACYFPFALPPPLFLTFTIPASLCVPQYRGGPSTNPQMARLLQPSAASQRLLVTSIMPSRLCKPHNSA
jgi:hypothetical protein